jgi:hypothetical protein
MALKPVGARDCGETLASPASAICLPCAPLASYRSDTEGSARGTQEDKLSIRAASSPSRQSVTQPHHRTKKTEHLPASFVQRLGGPSFVAGLYNAQEMVQ